MGIQATDILANKAVKFGASESSALFQRIVLDAINQVIDDVANFVEDSVSRIATTNEEIDLDEQKYNGLFDIGVDFYIVGWGEYTIANVDNLERKYYTKLRHRKSIVQRDDQGTSLSPKFGSLSS